MQNDIHDETVKWEPQDDILYNCREFYSSVHIAQRPIRFSFFGRFQKERQKSTCVYTVKSQKINYLFRIRKSDYKAFSKSFFHLPVVVLETLAVLRLVRRTTTHNDAQQKIVRLEG